MKLQVEIIFIVKHAPSDWPTEATVAAQPPISSVQNFQLFYRHPTSRTTKRRLCSDFAAVAGWQLPDVLACA